MTPLYNIRLMMGIALLTTSVTAEDAFPYASWTFTDDKLDLWTVERVHGQRDRTIGFFNENDSIMIKDNAASPYLIAYMSNDKEGISDKSEMENEKNGIVDPNAKTFKTELDLTKLNGLVNFAIHVDDIATLTVTEKLNGTEPNGYTPITKTYHVKGTALWRLDRSYKEFTNSIPAGRKYDLKLNYQNTANLTEKYKGPIDHDGVNVYLMHQPGFDLAIASYGNEANLPEDRQADGKSAPTPHEMDPGAAVIAPIAGSNGENLTPGKRARLTLTCDGSQQAGGIYTLSADPSLTKLKIYDKEEGGHPITLPMRLTASSFGSATKTYYVGSDAFMPNEKIQTGTLTLTYQGPEEEEGAEPELKDQVKVTLVPIEVVELSPILMDESGQIIPNSQKPLASPEENEMVEIDPLASPIALTDASDIRIAWRDIKVKFGKILVGKKIIWSMEPMYTPSVVKSTGFPEVLAPDPKGTRFRGSWDHAVETASKDAFSPSIAYGRHGWDRSSPTSGSTPGTATTIVDAEGYTAIRVNLPPIGFNKAKIKITIEGLDFEIDLIDLVVPAVVVIDPGHGGLLASKKIGGSSPNNAYSYGSAPTPFDPKKKRKSNETMADYRARLDPKKSEETDEEHWARLSVSLEKDLSLKYGIDLRSALRQRFGSDSGKLRIFMTRLIDKNVGISSRAKLAKLNGADIFFSIHYNSDVKDWVRGPEVILRSKANGNLNHSEDMAFAERIMNTLDSRVPDAPIKVANPNFKDELPDHRGIKQYPTNPTGVDNDSSLGNSEIGPCSHACLAEIEFMTSLAVEKSVVSGVTADDVRRSLCEGFAIAIRNDILARKGER